VSLRGTANLTVAALFLFVVAGVFLRPLAPIDETRYMAVAWEMWLSGDYFVPTRNFELYTHKPPLLFWSINVVWAVFGVSENAARLVAPIYALAGLLLVGRLARRLWPDEPEIGARTKIALSGLLIFAGSAGVTMFDAMLATATVAGMLALVTAARTGQWRWWVALGVALAMGVLSKGPVILLHVLPAAVLLPIWADGRWCVTWRRALAGTGVAFICALAIVGLWLGPALVMGGPDYREAVLWTQTAGRITDSFAHARPWWFFLALLPLLTFPWVFVPELWRAGRKATVWSEPGMRLALIWAGAALVFFSLISGKQIHYLVPELPAVALIVGRLAREAGPFRLTWAVLPLALAAALAAAAAAGLVPMGEAGPLLQPRSMLLAWALVIAAIGWGALLLGGLRGGAVLTLGTFLALNLLIGLTDIRAIYDTHRIAEVIAPYEDAGIAIIGQSYHAEFNFAGRLKRPVATPTGQEAIDAWIDAHPAGLIIGRPDRIRLPWRPNETIVFRGSPYALWLVARAPQKESTS
jgi:4-amino-4-deoxy-L-arabinose transferase-like glycosyltransferase